MTQKPLTEAERRAAVERAEGVSLKNVAAALGDGSNTRTVRGLEARDDFKALVAETREQSAPPAPTAPKPGLSEEEEVLERTMRAVNRKTGDPSPLAMQAAVALAKLRTAKAEEAANRPTVEREVVTLNADIDGKVRQAFAEADEGESLYVLLAVRECGRGATGARVLGLRGGLWGRYEAGGAVPWGSNQTDDGPARGPRR